jgi:hypothetical protein
MDIAERPAHDSQPQFLFAAVLLISQCELS